jgi:SsrA-binding protein
MGTEVKAARQGQIQLKDSYVTVRNGEAFLVGAHISPYSHGNRQNHEPERERKLLLHRRELDKIMGRTTVQGLTCVPLGAYLKGNRVKLEIALARGKKLHDKREAIATRESDRRMRQAVRRRAKRG